MEELRETRRTKGWTKTWEPCFSTWLAMGTDKPMLQSFWESREMCPLLGLPTSSPPKAHILLIHSVVGNLGDVLKTNLILSGPENRNWVGLARREKGLRLREACVQFAAVRLSVFLALDLVLLFHVSSRRWENGDTKSIPWARTAAQALPNGSGPTSFGGEEYYYLPSHGEWENQGGCLHHQRSLRQEAAVIWAWEGYSPCQ